MHITAQRHKLRWFTFSVLTDSSLPNEVGPFPQGIVAKMGVSRRCRRLSVSEQGADLRKAGPPVSEKRSVGVPQIVDAG